MRVQIGILTDDLKLQVGGYFNDFDQKFNFEQIQKFIEKSQSKLYDMKNTLGRWPTQEEWVEATKE